LLEPIGNELPAEKEAAYFQQISKSFLAA